MREEVDEVQLFPCEHKLCLHCMIDLQADTLKSQSKAICCKDCGEQVERFTHHRLKATRKRTRNEVMQNQELQNQELIQAFKDRDLPSVRNLLRSGAYVNAKDRHHGRTPLHEACIEGHVEVVIELVDEWDADFEANDYDGWTPLLRASDGGHQEVVRALLDRKADIHCKCSSGLTPLHRACSCGHVGTLQALLAGGANIHAKDGEGRTPLHTASYIGPLKIVKELISAGADIRAVNNYGEVPMEMALRHEESDIVKYLVKELYTSIFEHEGRLPIHAILKDTSFYGPTPLRKAREQDVLDTDDILKIITFLIAQTPGSLNAHNQDGDLPIHVACWTSANPKIVRFLIEQSPESFLVPRTSDGALTLHVALGRGASSDSDVIKMLLERHDPVTIMLRNNAGETPLHVACRRGASFEIVQSLCYHYKASVQAVTLQGDLPLVLACTISEPSLDVIYFLLKLYPDVVYP
jgi:ankyrin repeat protein